MTLFDSGLVRASDPAVSHEAAIALRPRLARQQERVLAALVLLREGTAADIVMRLAYTPPAPQQSVAAKRLTELGRMGYARPTGARKPGPSGQSCAVWQPTDAGRAWIGQQALL